MIEHTKNKTRDDIEDDAVLVDCVMFRLIQIAENSDKLTTEFKTAHKELPWREIKGMRNRIVHDYGIVDMTIIYDTISRDIPQMYDELKKLI